ncbi:MAG: hypothetical protein EBR33_13430 [Synechococcaceae bacterium WB4_1_0192]|nr:hypothetical protein [Synechococcaceae bacterium WB4_1_0192]
MHFLRNLLSHVPIGEAFSEGVAGREMVAAAMKAVFVIQAPYQVRAHWQRVTGSCASSSPLPRRSWKPRGMTCWPSCTSRRSTGARSGAPTRWSG